MDENNSIEKEEYAIDLAKVMAKLWSRRKVFFILWPVVFALSCLWILPQPRYYTCEVELAPEGGAEGVGGLAGLASDFGLNISGGATADAIYPTLYPELFESPEFLVDLLSVTVETDNGDVKTDYYTYLKKHQQKNWLTQPFKDLKKSLTEKYGNKEESKRATGGKLNPFYLSKKDFKIVEKVKDNIQCSVDKKTDVITIKVTDQDRYVCALLADSVRERLQDFIIVYRTKKVRQDEQYYKHLTDSARVVYEKAVANYGAYQDGHRNVVMQEYVELGEKIKNDLSTKLSAYNTFNTQYQAMKAKVQERTPSFTTLKSATVPQRPAGPKRMIFVAGMLILATLFCSLWILRRGVVRYFTT